MIQRYYALDSLYRALLLVDRRTLLSVESHVVTKLGLELQKSPFEIGGPRVFPVFCSKLTQAIYVAFKRCTSP